MGQVSGSCTNIETERVRTGWLINGDIVGGWDNSAPRGMSIVDFPADQVMFAENDVSPPGEAAINNPPGSRPQTAQMAISPCRTALHAVFNSRWTRASPRNGTGRLGAHHSDGTNLVLADGHVKWKKEPPTDCAAWVPGMPKNTRLTTQGGSCRPAGTGVSFCN